MNKGLLTGILVSGLVLSMGTIDFMSSEVFALEEVGTEIRAEVLSSSDFTFADGVILKYNGTSRGVIEIPSYINGQLVHTIGEEAFYNKIMITSVVIPETVHTIETNAFKSCSNLTSVTIPKSVNVIGVSAFASSTMISNVYYGGSASDRDKILTNGNSYFFSSPQWHYHTGSSAWSVTQAAGSGVATVPYYSTVTAESDFQFKDGVITKYVGTGKSVVVIPASINGESVKSIGASAFFDVSTVLAIAVPSTVMTIEVNAFQACTDLVSIILPSSLRVVGATAFTSCTSLKGVYYGGSKEDWANVLVGNNSALLNVGFWEYLSSLAGKTSTPVSKLHTILNEKEDSSSDFTYYDGTIVKYNGSGDSVVVIPTVFHGEKVVAIADYAFQNKNSILGVVIPDTVEVIGTRAFEACSNLQVINLPESVVEIGASAFSSCGSLTDVYYGLGWDEKAKISMSSNITLENYPKWHYYSLSTSEPEPEPLVEEEVYETAYYSEWAESFVTYAEEQGLLKASLGMNYTVSVTREQIAELLVSVVEKYTGRIMTKADVSVFSDTSNESVLKALQNGIVSGQGDGKFGGSATATREEIAVMMVKTLDVMEKLTGRTLVERNTKLKGFDDVDSVSSWAVDSLGVMVNLGIISGIGESTLAPKSATTIEQCLVMICNLYTI